jgi:hypothetical protein
VTVRRDIDPNQNGWRRLSYTCRCGWVDWGHASPGSATELKLQVDTEQSNWPGLGQMSVRLDGSPAYIINYGQGMGIKPVMVTAYRHWVVKKGLTAAQRRSVSLGIFLSASFEFETLQGSFPYSIVSGASSFSVEDLISNLIGFYGVYNSIYGPPGQRLYDARMRQLCGEVTVKESYRIWDTHLPGGLSTLRHRGLQPLKFPCPECDEKNTDTSFPVRLSGIQPAPEGALWVRVKNRFIDGRLANARQAIDVSSRGEVTVRRMR